MRLGSGQPRTKLLTRSAVKDARVRKNINVHIAVMDYGVAGDRRGNRILTHGSGRRCKRPQCSAIMAMIAGAF